MKAEELMIGDWVYGLDKAGGKHPSCISAVDIYPNNKTPRIVTYGGYGYQVEDLEPIPLTPEILEKNADGGWCNYQSEPKGRSIYHIGEVAVYVEWERIVPSPYIELHGLGDTFFKGYVDSVHQLQHALKLCRINLEIKL